MASLHNNDARYHSTLQDTTYGLAKLVAVQAVMGGGLTYSHRDLSSSSSKYSHRLSFSIHASKSTPIYACL